MPLPLLNKFPLLQKLIIAGLILAILFTQAFSAPVALFAGLVVGLVLGNPWQKYTSLSSKYALQIAVVGLGFSIDLHQVSATGLSGILYTAISLSVTLGLGFILGKALGIQAKLSHLIGVGTAICGGSAIAAVAPTIKADATEISVSLAIVFILNALALFTFPVVGHWFELTQSQFGVWAAIAIHDTSSVVGAASRYGLDALQIATTLKLTRALWIIPMVLLSAFLFKSKETKLSLPLFIPLFLVASVLYTFVPVVSVAALTIVLVAKKLLVLSLFFIGINLNPATLKKISARPFLQGFILWVLVTLGTLLAVIFL
ncbi:putative sulfate exporter family transporter [Pontibacter sp. KCTC 32443]|uniref:YeiH family protein n=1 Tax=Pontibacter TaxID=323449 RepID=UPI00164EC85E|nr:MULTISPECIES: putative sulfate exporter family transporter [Pontibacter]MBC5772508.1 putative sulfate exporter family transporter [Pontibacter sp. KCTC 32443]